MITMEDINSLDLESSLAARKALVTLSDLGLWDKALANESKFMLSGSTQESEEVLAGKVRVYRQRGYVLEGLKSLGETIKKEQNNDY